MPDAPDFAAATAAQQRTWSEGDFSMVASMIYNVAEQLAEALEILPDERVLDVACGSGNGAIAAARRTWGSAVGFDFVPALLERGRERAAAERLEVEFVEADAQDLPFEDASFDVAMSIFGAMFAPDQEKTAPSCCGSSNPAGGSGWRTGPPTAASAKFFVTLVKHTGGPPPGTVPPVLWGSEEHVRGLFGDGISELRVERRRRPPGLPLRRPLPGVLPHLLRPDQNRLRQSRPGGRAGAGSRPARLPRRGQHDDERALVLEPEYLQIVAIRA